MKRPARTIADLIFDGRLDVLLSGGLGVLCLGLGLGLAFHVEPLEILLDLAACAAAAATAKWPRVAGIVLTAIVYAYVAAPLAWATLGAYATLIPILGTGLREQRVARRWFTASYLAVVPALVYRESGEISTAVFGTLVWSAIIALAWIMGNLFVAYRRTAARDAAVAVAEQQMAVARDLHDTVARTLSNIVLQARQQREGNDPDAFDDLLAGCEVALGELRGAVLAMREVGAPTLEQPAPARSLQQALDEAKASLTMQGEPPSLAVEGYPTRMDAEVENAVVAAFDEVVANVRRHGTPPCTIIATTGEDSVDIVVLNAIKPAADEDHPGVGLLGARERLEKVGGILETRTEGTRWLTRIAVPVR